MNLNDYQKEALKTAVYPGIGNNLIYPVLGLCGEAGEVSNKVAKTIRDNKYEVTPQMKQDLIDELGDVFWFLAVTASELNCSLEDIAIINLKKLASRKERGELNGTGDHR